MSVCVWNIGSPCDGEVSGRGMFGNQISVPVCASHYREHLVLLTLNRKFNKEIEDLLAFSSDERLNLLSTLTTDIDAAIKETAEIDSAGPTV